MPPTKFRGAGSFPGEIGPYRAMNQTLLITERSKEVLRVVVETYLETGEPIGSRTLAARLGIELSPATIRNVMADLQDAGLLYAPHTSAGRLPTDTGLRLFVDGILQVGRLDEAERQAIDAQCNAAGRLPQQVLEEATKMLSGLSSCAGLVLAPKSEATLRHIEFVSLGPGRALVVLVTEDGAVENRVITVPLGLPASSLVEATNFLSARMLGRTLQDAQDQLTIELDGHRQDLDALTRKLVEAGLATWTGEGDTRSLIVSGANTLLEDVYAVEDIERVRILFDALDTKKDLVRLLDAAANAEGVQIFIGSANKLFGLAGCAMITAPYTNSKQEILGAVGVIGPMRVNYARIIPVVDYTAKVVGRLLG